MKTVLLATTVALTLMTSVSWSAEPTQVSFDVTVVDAKKTPGQMDPKLEHIKDVLQRSFKGYKSFTQVNRSQFKVAEGATHTTPLAGSQKLKVGVKPGGAKGFLKVRLVSGDLKTTVDVRDGGLFFQAVRGPKGAALVVAIRATELVQAGSR